MSRHEYITSFVSKERTRIMYEEFMPGFDLVIGKVNQNKAYKPIEPHIHPDAFEIVYIVKGEQIYTIEDCPYTVCSGQCFITLPNELHSSGGHPEDKSILYYAIIPIQLVLSLGFDHTESIALLQAFSNPSQRTFQGHPQLPQLFERLATPPDLHAPLFKTEIKQTLVHLLLTMLTSIHHHPAQSHTILSKVTTYIHEHIQHPIAIHELAQLMNLSESRFKTYFRQCMGLPPAEYILREKINRAKVLLEQTSLSVTDIAYELSFSSSQYFATVFKRFTTLSPAQYRTNTKKET